MRNIPTEKRTAHISNLIDQINQLTAVPEQYFTVMYLSSLNNYLIKAQGLNSEEILSKLTCIINGLKIRRSLILPVDALAEDEEKTHDIWTYAVFVTLLLYRLVDDFPDKSTKHLLSELICSEGIDWLSQDMAIINTVIKLIENPTPSSPIGALIYKAYNEPIAICHTATDKEIPPATSTPRNDTQAAQLFRRWLMEKISNSNQSENIHDTKNGTALLDPAIFNEFSGQHKHTDSQALRQAFFRLNLHQRDNKGRDTLKMDIPGIGHRNVILLTSIKRKTSLCL